MMIRFTAKCSLLIVYLTLICAVWAKDAGPTQLQDFPEATKLWLSHVQGGLGPTKQEAFISEGSGTLRILKNHGETVKKSEVYAIFRPENLELEQRSVASERTLLSSKIEEARTAREEKLIASETQVAEIKAVLQDLKAASQVQQVKSDPILREQLQSSISDKKEQLARLETRLKTQSDPKIIDSEVEQLKIAHERIELEFVNATKNAEKRALFDGAFLLSTEMVAEHGSKKAPYDIWVEPTQLVGRTIDDSSYEISIAQYPAILNQSRLESLAMEIPIRANEPPITAKYLETKNVPKTGRGGNEERVLIFQINPADRERAAPLAGTTSLGQIYQTLPPGCHLVPKTKIAELIGNKEKQTGGWSTYVDAIWPDCELVASGHLHLAIRLKNSESAKPQPKPSK